MATIRLDLADGRLAALQRARLPQGGLQLPRAPLEAGMVAGQGLADIGRVVTGATQVIEALAEVEQRTAAETTQNRARSAGLRAMAEVEQEANGDVERYRAGTREAFERIADGIEDPRARQLFLSRIEPEAAAIEFRVRRAGTARRGAEAVASLEEVLRESGTRAAAADNPVEREALRQAGRERIEAAIAAGYLTPAAARTRAGRFDAEVSTATVMRLTAQRPNEAVRLLQDPDQLPGLTPVQRYRLLDRAVREAEAAAGGRRVGGGARRLREQGLPVPPLPPEELSAIEEDGDRQAAALDEAQEQRALVAERTAISTGAIETRSSAMAWFGAAAGEDADPDEVARFNRLTDLQPPAVVEAARAVALTGGATTDDGPALDALLREAGELPPDAFVARAAQAVAEGRITPGGWLRLTRTNEALRADPAWARERSRADQDMAVPDVSDLVPDVGDLGALRREALAEIDAWRAANPRAGAGQARAAADEIAGRARRAMADALMARLPAPEGFAPGSGPYAPAALDEEEMAVLSGMDAGEIGMDEAGRRLRVLEAWRWAAHALDAGEAAPDADGGRLRGMRLR